MFTMPRKSALLPVFAIALAGCGLHRPVLIDPALLTLVPGNATMAAGVRAEALRETPFYKKWGAARIPDAAGVDLKNKAWQILVATDGRRTTLLARGKFVADGAEPPTPAGYARDNYKGYTMFTGPAQAVAFLNPSTIVAGAPESVRFVIDQRGRTSGPPAALRRQMEKAAARGQVWLAGAGDFSLFADAAPQSGNFVNLAKLLAPVETLVAAADFTSGVKVTAEAVSHTEQDAQALENALGALLALGRLGIRDPDVLRAYEAIKAERKGKTLFLNAALPEEAVDKLLAKR